MLLITVIVINWQMSTFLHLTNQQHSSPLQTTLPPPDSNWTPLPCFVDFPH